MQNRQSTFCGLIGISETRITKKINKISNINLNNSAFEAIPNESSPGETIICIANHLAYKPRTDL